MINKEKKLADFIGDIESYCLELKEKSNKKALESEYIRNNKYEQN